MIISDTDSQDDTETDHAYDQSSDQEVIMDILCPDLDSNSDSDSDDSLFGSELLHHIGATDHIVPNVQSMKGQLTTFIIKIFNAEPVSALFDTGATCSNISNMTKYLRK